MSAARIPGKWIDGLAPDQPAAKVARRVLRRRLEAVQTLLPLAAERAEEDEEYIHQLRVATRRADAALRLFRPCLSPGRYRKTRRRLRRLRRAAGAARECDVHGGLLRAQRDAADGDVWAALDELVAWTTHERASAQHLVEDVAWRFQPARLKKNRRRVLAAIRHPELEQRDQAVATGKNARHPTFLDLARATFPALAEGVRDAAGRDLREIDNLHNLRLRGKRLRYGLEVFRDCFGPTFKDDYKVVEALQEELGAINDWHELAARVTAFLEDAANPAGAAAGGIDESRLRAAAELVQQQFLQARDEAAAAFRAAWDRGAWRRLLSIDLETGQAPSSPDPVPAGAHGEASPT
ncbi:MAG: CHAD domain-containing protein [Planctomycetota bacterium]|jgi:CHAD domain-containing protein